MLTIDLSRGEREHLAMADGEIILRIEAVLAHRLRALADASGQTVEAFATARLSEAADEDALWAQAYAALDEYDRTGGGVTLGAATAEFREAVLRNFDHKA